MAKNDCKIDRYIVVASKQIGVGTAPNGNVLLTIDLPSSTTGLVTNLNLAVELTSHDSKALAVTLLRKVGVGPIPI